MEQNSHRKNMKIGDLLSYGAAFFAGAALFVRNSEDMVNFFANNEILWALVVWRLLPAVVLGYVFYAGFIRRWEVDSKTSHDELEEKISNKHINRLRRRFGSSNIVVY